MPISKNLTTSPYFDDFDSDKDYYRILFKPSTAVQVRELNQLQTILQNQIEEFGDVVLKRGTLLDGCQATFNDELPFVKILDVTEKGSVASVPSYVDLFVRGTNANVVARIVDGVNGFESQTPDLKTLYLRYLNSGVNSNKDVFEPEETLEVYNRDFRLYDIAINNGSTSFSNADRVVILSAIAVQNTTGGKTFGSSFVVGESLTQPGGQQVELIAADSVSNNEFVILQIKPLDADLSTSNTSAWSLNTSQTIIGANSTNEAAIVEYVGSGASATFATTPGGTIDTIVVTSGGSGYTKLPFVGISSQTASNTNVSTLSLLPANYLARVTVANNTFVPVGTGYSMTISEGKIYQKGYFLNVEPQSVIVEKYSNMPSDIAVGFETIETIANSSVDASLLDNAAGFLNQNAPGADRLQLTPRLVVKSDAASEGDSQFLPIYRFSEGRPYSQRTTPEYNKIADELAKRTYEESGNYVLNPFEMTTRSTASISNSDTSFAYLIDPGLAYINGYRVETLRNFAKNVDKSRNTAAVTNTSIDVVYGSYVRVNEFAGLPSYNTGDIFELHSTPGLSLSVGNGAIVGPNTQIGTARIRSVVSELGSQGNSKSSYRVYLYDIRMNRGASFESVRSIYSTNFIADVITELDPRNDSKSIAVLKDKNKSSLLFSVKRPLKSISNLDYTFRTTRSNVAISSNGVITVVPESGASFPYAGTLSTLEKTELTVVPENNLVANSDLSGTVSATNTTITGFGTSFLTELRVGDYVLVGTDIAAITSIANNTSARYEPEGELNNLNSENFKKIHPANIPLPIANSSNISASVGATNLTIDIGMNLTSANTVGIIFNQKYENTPSVDKPATRKAYVKIQANTNSNGVNGPWCLGVPDVIRLRNVYAGDNTSATNITNEFIVDVNTNESFYDLSLLVKKPKSAYTIGSDDILLVEFDCFEAASDYGVKTINSYTINDELSLSQLDVDANNSINTAELGEVILKDRYYDLRESIDFRPVVKATASIALTPAGATINPTVANTSDFFVANDIQFPTPEGDAFFDVEYYLPRVDTILINGTGEFEFLLGREINTFNPNQFPLYRVDVPAYPSYPKNLSFEMSQILDKKISSGTFSSRRLDRFSITSEEIRRQTRGYTMEDIAKLDRRIAILEYYANLSETENKISQLSIPSTIDSTLERFKFGFFVDNFATYNFTDVDSPEHNSTIYEYVLQPATINYSVPLRVATESKKYLKGTEIHFPYSRKKLLSQSFATTGPVAVVAPTPVPAPGVPSPSPSPGPVVPRPVPVPTFANSCRIIKHRNLNFTPVNTSAEYAAQSNPATWDGISEETTFKMTSNNEAEGELITLNFSLAFGSDRFVIQQSKNATTGFVTVFDTKNNLALVDNLTETERRTLNGIYVLDSAAYGDTWTRDPDFDDAANLTADPVYANSKDAGFLKYIGKIQIPYKTFGGRYLRVIVQKASPVFAYYICYPADAVRDPVLPTVGSTTLPIIDSEPTPFVIQAPGTSPLPTIVNDPGDIRGVSGLLNNYTAPSNLSNDNLNNAVQQESETRVVLSQTNNLSVS